VSSRRRNWSRRDEFHIKRRHGLVNSRSRIRAISRSDNGICYEAETRSGGEKWRRERCCDRTFSVRRETGRWEPMRAAASGRGPPKATRRSPEPAMMSHDYLCRKELCVVIATPLAFSCHSQSAVPQLRRAQVGGQRSQLARPTVRSRADMVDVEEDDTGVESVEYIRDWVRGSVTLLPSVSGSPLRTVSARLQPARGER